MEGKLLAPSIRAEVLEELVHFMRAALTQAAAHTQATDDEIYSAVFSLALRTVHATVDVHRNDRAKEFKTRKDLTVICEKLWVAAAGEPFTRHEKKRAKGLPS